MSRSAHFPLNFQAAILRHPHAPLDIGTVTFNGTAANQVIKRTGGEIFTNLVVDKSSGRVRMDNKITVNGSLTLTQGDLNLNSRILTLGENATLSETPGNTVVDFSTGSITTTRTLQAPAGENVAGLGISITSSKDLGATTITRQHYLCTGDGNEGIHRSYQISPAKDSALNATLVFRYDESELNGLQESDLILFHSTDDGTTWTSAGGVVDTANNSITLTGVNSFSLWTAASSSSPLPVQFASISAVSDRLNVFLKWSTATETDNDRFEIERRMVADGAGIQHSDSASWQTIGSVDGMGTSTAPKVYTFNDKLNSSGRYSYRLRQINRDGSFMFSAAIEVVTKVPLSFSLAQNYPNPFNPTTTIKYDLPEQVAVRLTVFDMLGREVRTLVSGLQEPGYYKVVLDAKGLSSGVYFYRLHAGEFVKVKRLVLLK